MIAPAYGVGGTAGGGGEGPPAFTVDIFPNPATGGRAVNFLVTVASEYVTATPSGGTAPYTYACTAVDVSSGDWTISDPASAVSRFLCANVDIGETFSATFKWTVTDSLGLSADSPTLEVFVTNYGAPGEPIP